MLQRPSKDYSFEVIGSVSTQPPELLGRSAAVNHATQYVLDSHLLFKRRGLPDSPANHNLALKSGARAMQSLRAALENQQHNVSDEILVATKLLIMAEV